MRKTAKQLCEGELVPRGYGLAWQRYDMDMSVYLPIPINIIASKMREYYFRLVIGCDQLDASAYMKGHRKGYGSGRDAGVKEGWKQGWDDAFDGMLKQIDGRGLNG